MRKVQPYFSFDGAARALDNGGRLWNVFTHASDRVITKAEIGKAGGGGGAAGALLFFALATSRLDRGEREELVGRLEPRLRRQWERSGPLHLRPGELAGVEETKRPCIVEGRVRRCRPDEEGLGFVPVMVMIGNVPMTHWYPAGDQHSVAELSDGSGSCLALAGRKRDWPEGQRVLVGGTVKEGRRSKDSSRDVQRFLEARYWQPLEG